MAFGATSIIDNFNRANEGPPMTGWGPIVSGLVVVSNACGPSGSGLRSSYWTTIMTAADCEVYVTIASNPASNRSLYTYARLKEIGAGTTDGYALKFNKLSGTDTLQIIRVDNGSETVLGADFSQELVAGDKFGLELVGSTLTAYVDTGAGWTSLGSRTDSTYGAAGYSGLGIASGTLDDFGGGDLSSGVSGSLNVTLDNITSSASGSVAVEGALNITLDNITLNAAGIAGSIEGALNVTLDNITSSASGTVGGGVSGSLDVTLDNITLVASGVAGSISGSLNKTLADITLSASGIIAAALPVPSSSGGPIPLALQLYESRGGALIADFSDATDCVIDNGRHGFRSLACFVPMPLELAFSYSEQGKAKWLSLNYGCGVAWEGRVEDLAVVVEAGGTGLALTAFGCWNAFYDVPYTALWSKSGTAGWRVVTSDDVSTALPAAFDMDNNSRLWIAFKNGESHDNSIIGMWSYRVPDDSSREFIGIEFDYILNGATTQEFRIQTFDSDWNLQATVTTITGTGSQISGCLHKVFSAAPIIVIYLRQTNGTPLVYASPTGSRYLKVTNIRAVTATTNRINTTTTTTISAGSQVVTPVSMTGIYVGQRLFIDEGLTTSESVVVTAVTSTTFTATFANGYSGTTTIESFVVYADEIISDLVSHVTADNPAQLSDSAALIESPGLDLLDEAYEDEWPADIATKLAGLGDDQDPPRLWEVGVWEEQRLHFRPKGSDSQVWAVDADELTVNSTLALLRNSFYAAYQDANNRTLRTAVSDDAASQALYGIVRRGVVLASTTSETQAEKHRVAALEDGRVVKPRSELRPDYLMDQTGAIAPKWLARAGQTMNIRNLPPTLGSEVDRIRTFLLEENSYSPIEDVLTPVPEEPLASLEVLIARKDEGF